MSSPSKPMFHTASTAEILEGSVTDVYFDRSQQILAAEKADKPVVAEFVVKRFPGGAPWGVFAGLEEAAHLLRSLPVKVRALPEGSLFREHDPVLVIEGNYLDFGRHETAILGFLCQASGIATRAARCKLAADGRPVLSFGARRMHPAIVPMIERNAYIGGCDGVATVKSAELLGIPPSGTMPHALILIMGDTLKAMQAFDRHISSDVNRICLVDTFNDEKFEAVRIAEAMRDKLFAVRLDTPSSRRGDLLGILREVRWELDLRGFEHVKLFVSGGLDVDTILQYNAVADGYGVGTAISAAPVLDYSMDIVEIDGRPIAKRGKASGRKQLLRCAECERTRVAPAPVGKTACPRCGGKETDALQPVWDGESWLAPARSAGEIRADLLNELRKLPKDG